MTNSLPREISDYFLNFNQELFPKLEIPQYFEDNRGLILNIADGLFSDVAVIRSKKGAVRANHIHSQDWHLSFCLSGSLIYSFEHSTDEVQSLEVIENELFFTPASVPHRMDFLQDTCLVVISKNSRLSANYESDTRKYMLPEPKLPD
jgi:dTDP-4-dehydrorhamnose 3,5-epimerase-like enzyme